jgi:hypothetical protein
MRIGGNETVVLIATTWVIISVITTAVSGMRRTRSRRRLRNALDLDHALPAEGYAGLRALLAAEVRDCADRLERMEWRTMVRRRARSGGTFAVLLIMTAAFLTALALPAAPASGSRPFVLIVAGALAVMSLAIAFRRDVAARSPFLKRSDDSTDPLPHRRPTLLAIWRWFPAGFSSSVDDSEDTITARVPSPTPDLNWRQEAFPSSG